MGEPPPPTHKNKKIEYVQERNTLCTFCARTMFSLSLKYFFSVSVFKMKNLNFLSGIQRILMMNMKLRKKKERKRRNILYFVHIQLQQSNFTKILSIAIRDTADRPKNRRKIKMTSNFITIFEILFVK